MRPRLFVPGWGGSGPEHWQTRWQAQMRGARRVEMPDWFAPARGPWLAALDRAVAAIIRDTGQRPIAIAHSLGCIAVAAWAAEQRVPGLAGALLVAPSDVERADAAAVLREFGPVPRARLGFPAQVVVSDDDPYVELARARAFAEAWGAGLTVVPGAGHLNVASGHGEWPAGLELLRQLALAPAA
ncbi:MAG: alpha/beta hydrolase [Kofleriaceae bacterium]|jgi:predicted alpha/beta hydrolase family esterase|nr:alpha/beta hydrolase [Kofleriaceae bacterium]MBP9172197.1 alpha/beta hydrolase [Kofleriaceae bacterium]MBP9863042.1 alpha/beta hydrolase [Kofleriaceae bacterium]